MLQLTPKQWQEMMELDTVLVKVHDGLEHLIETTPILLITILLELTDY